MSIAPLMSVLGCAVKAPSSHNAQPWRFRCAEGVVEVRADRTRALPVNDPDDRELTIGCGCALYNLRAAAEAYGMAPTVEALPVADCPDLLARVRFGTLEASGAAAAEAGVLDAIEQRRTYRKRFRREPVPQAAIAACAEAARAEGGWLQTVEGDQARRALAALVAEGDALQWADPGWRRELAAWMHPRRRGDGLPASGMGGVLQRAAVRSIDMGGGMAARDSRIAEDSPLIVAIGAGDDSPGAWLRAGLALEAVLLAGVARGLQASYLNQPVQVAALRPRLRSLLGDPAGSVQVLLRLGYPAEPLEASPRRDLSEVVD